MRAKAKEPLPYTFLVRLRCCALKKPSAAVIFNLAVLSAASFLLWLGYSVHSESFKALSVLNEEVSVAANVSCTWNGANLSQVTFDVRIKVVNPSNLVPLKLRYVALKGGAVFLDGTPLVYPRPQNVRLERVVPPRGSEEVSFSITLGEDRDLSITENLLRKGADKWRLGFTMLVEVAHVRGFVECTVTLPAGLGQSL